MEWIRNVKSFAFFLSSVLFSKITSICFQFNVSSVDSLCKLIGHECFNWVQPMFLNYVLTVWLMIRPLTKTNHFVCLILTYISTPLHNNIFLRLDNIFSSIPRFLLYWNNETSCCCCHCHSSNVHTFKSSFYIQFDSLQWWYWYWLMVEFDK